MKEEKALWKKGAACPPTKFIPVVELQLAALIRRVVPDSGHSIFEIEQSRLDLRACGEWAPELSRMIRSIESPRPNGTRFGKKNENLIHKVTRRDTKN